MPEIWLPSVTTVCDDDPTIPLVTYEQPPDTVTSVAGGYYSMEDRLPGRATSGLPLHPYWLVSVRDEDVKKFKSTVAEKDVPEEARLMVAMARTCGAELTAKAGQFFAGIDGITALDADRALMVKRVLVQAVARGLAPVEAERIKTQYSLPSEAVVR